MGKRLVSAKRKLQIKKWQAAGAAARKRIKNKIKTQKAINRMVRVGGMTRSGATKLAGAIEKHIKSFNKKHQSK